MNTLFDLDSSIKSCPICDQRPIHEITKTVKVGITTEKDGRYSFNQTGTRESTNTWWTCKPCTKLPINEYVEHMVEHFNK